MCVPKKSGVPQNFDRSSSVVQLVHTCLGYLSSFNSISTGRNIFLVTAFKTKITMLAEIFTQLKLNILNIAKKDGKNRKVLLMQGNVTLLRTSRLMVLMVN